MVEKSLLGISLAFNDMYKLAYGLLFASLHSKPDLDRYMYINIYSVHLHVHAHLHVQLPVQCVCIY